uniref:Dymeclin n=1 Tax=Romanomermis culicivorax TaxID=13658 RepID=A0A915HY56_ROMCU
MVRKPIMDPPYMDKPHWITLYQPGLSVARVVRSLVEVSSLTIPTCAVATFKFDYSVLYEQLCTKAGQEPSLLLLYLLVHRNAGFKNFVLSRVNMENVSNVLSRNAYDLV